MTTHHPITTTRTDPCPTCTDTDVHWVGSTPGTDTWACRACGTEWAITLDTPEVTR